MDQASTIVSGSKVYRPLMDDRLTSEDLRKAREELKEKSESREAVLRICKERISEEQDLNPRMDDEYLIRFLRVRKYDYDLTIKLLRDHYKFRAKNPAVFPAPSSIEEALKSNIFNYLPHRDDQGRAICVVKIGLWDPDEVTFNDFLATGNIISEYVLDNPVTQINGYVGLWDFKGFTFKQFMNFCFPNNIFLLTTLMQDRFPGRLKMAYAVNCHPLVNTAWKIFRPLIKEKFRYRIKILGKDMSNLHQFIDPYILPEEYGGVMPPSDCQEIAQRVLSEEQTFNNDRKFGFLPKDI